MPGQGQPFGDIFSTDTPQIQHVQDQMWQSQQQRMLWQQREDASMNQIMDREFAKVRSVDVPDVMNSYNQYKNLKKQQLFNPSVQNNPQAYNEIQQQASQALADTFSKIDQSTQVNQMARDLQLTRRTHPDIFSDDFGTKFKTMMSTAAPKLDQTQNGGEDLSNPDTYRYKGQIDFGKLDKTAYDTEEPRSQPETAPNPNDPLSNTVTTYKYGNNPLQYKSAITMALAKLPTGEREASAALSHFTPEQIDEVNRQYYADNPQKWMRTTGQSSPMNVEPSNPNSAADQYTSLITKLRWLNSNPSVANQRDVPNRAVVTATKSAEQEKLQSIRNKQQVLMEGYRQNDAVSRIELRRGFQLQDEAGKDQMVDDNFNDEINKAMAQVPQSIPTASGQPLTFYPVQTSPVVEKPFAATDDKGHKMVPDQMGVTPDGKNYVGVYVKNGMVDDVNTKSIPIENLKPIYRKDLLGQPRHAVPTNANPNPKPGKGVFGAGGLNP